MEIIALCTGETFLGLSANYLFVLADKNGITWETVHTMWNECDAVGLQREFGHLIAPSIIELVEESKVVSHHRGREREQVYDK